MKVSEQSFVFTPELRLYDAGSHINVVFDSQSTIDAARVAGWTRLPKDFKRLSFKLEGFDSPKDEGPRRELAGKILFAYTTDAAKEVEEPIADCLFVFNSGAKPDKKGAFSHISTQRVEYAVRQALASALTDALNDYFDAEAGAASGASPAGSQELSGVYVSGRDQPRRLSRREIQRSASLTASQVESRRKRNTRLAWILPPIVVVALLGGMQLLASKQSPIENAVAQQMANDPESIKQQVDLVNQTLQSMGLDPGKGGDLGCLAPQ